MKKTLLILCFFSISFFTKAQDAKEILQKAWEKCQTIKNGYYEMTSYMKYMDNKDTVPSFFKCYFKKLKDDSIYPSAFHYQQYRKMAYSGDVVSSPKNSTI